MSLRGTKAGRAKSLQHSCYQHASPHAMTNQGRVFTSARATQTAYIAFSEIFLPSLSWLPAPEGSNQYNAILYILLSGQQYTQVTSADAHPVTVIQADLLVNCKQIEGYHIYLIIYGCWPCQEIFKFLIITNVNMVKGDLFKCKSGMIKFRQYTHRIGWDAMPIRFHRSNSISCNQGITS